MSLPISPAHAAQLAALLGAASQVRVVVVGATALGYHLPLPRDTKDVDLAVAVAVDDVPTLMAAVGWARDPDEVQRWNGPEAFRVDVVPASAELVEQGEVRLDAGAHRMSLVGFDLVFRHAERVTLPGTSVAIDVAALSTLVVLKMVAFLDRPHARARDLGDLDHVLRNALSEDDDRRWDEPLITAGVEFDCQSAYFMGREVAAIALAKHRAKVQTFIERLTGETGQDWAGVTAREVGDRRSGADEAVRARWRAFAKGYRSSVTIVVQ
ncbi:nucleotidyl transferase AbiEii/AbiGii toxin family protein [Myxococcota bacterium]|nr:nucleotidyl transferase AbiEii/AbiGii toxin family protein [Myxococcota bacterium]